MPEPELLPESVPRSPRLPPESRQRTWSALLGGIRLRFGPGELKRLGETVRELKVSRVLLVTDPGVRRAGHADAAVAALEGADLAVGLFDGVVENPTTREVEAGVAAARETQCQALVGLGGGSAMDCAKGINFLLTNGGRMEDYRGFGKVSRPLLPSAGVPTTAGTGSDAQSFALISGAEDHRKMACGDPGARFRAVILDPDLLRTVPPRVAACTGLDAVSHAVESYVSRAANPVSRLLAREAWRLLHGSLPRALDGSAGDAERADLLLGAHLAGAAIEQSMLGAAHACANPVTALHGVTHGEAVALFLPHVVRFNRQEVAARYAELELAAGLEPEGGDALAAEIEALRAQGGLAARLGERGVEEAALPELAEAASREWTAGFNPRRADAADLEELYAAAC